MLSALGVIVVHHRSENTVMRAVQGAIAQGVAPSRVVVVDNSEDADVTRRLRTALDGVSARLVSVANRGYANAVNEGQRHLNAVEPDLGLIAVLTHEVQLGDGCLARIVEGMSADHRIGAAGPALVAEAESARVVWSCGGRLSTLLRLPSHKCAGEVYRPSHAEECDWLDGAMVVYRANLLSDEAMDERFFMYYEETEYHTRLRRLGYRIVCFGDVVASQTTGGMPGWIRGRNGQLFQFLHGTRISRVLAGPVDLVRSGLRVLVRRVPSSEVSDQWSGWRSAWKDRARFAAGTASELRGYGRG